MTVPARSAGHAAGQGNRRRCGVGQKGQPDGREPGLVPKADRCIQQLPDGPARAPSLVHRCCCLASRTRRTSSSCPLAGSSRLAPEGATADPVDLFGNGNSPSAVQDHIAGKPAELDLRRLDRKDRHREARHEPDGVCPVRPKRHLPAIRQHYGGFGNADVAAIADEPDVPFSDVPPGKLAPIGRTESGAYTRFTPICPLF